MKKVKAIAIAKELGISKTTVSLALNNKAGVSEETRKKILTCKERMENQEGNETNIYGYGKLIKILFVDRGLHIEWGANMDFPSNVMAIFDSEAKKDCYTLGISYVSLKEESIQLITNECMQDSVAGIILLATELKPEDMKYFSEIKKPMVIYDCDLNDEMHHCVIADNRRGVRKAINYLFSKNIRDIVYLANKVDIYNFQERRKAVQEVFLENNLNKNIIEIGTSVENVYQNMKLFMKQQSLPEAFLMESYQITIGVLRALREEHLDIPKDISLIGIDELPQFFTGGIRLTTIKIPHEERAIMAMDLLKKEIQEEIKIKSRIYTDCKLIEGDSVLEKNKSL